MSLPEINLVSQPRTENCYPSLGVDAFWEQMGAPKILSHWRQGRLPGPLSLGREGGLEKPIPLLAVCGAQDGTRDSAASTSTGLGRLGGGNAPGSAPS